MNYKVLGMPLYSMPEGTTDETREARNEAITDTLLELLKNQVSVIRVNVGGYVDELICDGVYAWADLDDMIDRLPIKDGVDLVQYDNGNLGLVAYYNSRTSYLEILTDADEVARVREAAEDDD